MVNILKVHDMKSRLILSLIILLASAKPGLCQRIKDIVDIQGVRGNPLTGVGLVIGLTNTGDTSLPSQQILSNILKDSGIYLQPADFTGSNVALVMVTAQLGPFSRQGSHIDIVVSSIGDAKSLQGGVLIPTPLKGLDEQVYAVAQGGVSIAGWTTSGAKATISKNHQTVGTISGGAIVEKEEIADFVEYIASQRFVTLNLRNVDFSTAEQIGKIINQSYPDSALVVDAGTIKVKIPDKVSQDGVVGFIDDIIKYDVKVDVPAVVVINERTGTIVVGESVGISSVAISQGSLTIKIRERDVVSQPSTMFTENATTKVTQATDLSVKEAEGVLIPVRRTVTVAELANTLNAIGATPTDLIAIFYALKKAGALQATLEVM
jgi:flagellar P-ring protein FlgI